MRCGAARCGVLVQQAGPGRALNRAELNEREYRERERSAASKSRWWGEGGRMRRGPVEMVAAPIWRHFA